MDRNIQNFFAGKERMNERKFHSLDGDQWNTPRDFELDGAAPAASNTPVPQASYQTSSPLIIRVQNTNAAVDEANVVLLQAYARIQFAQTAGDHWGNANNVRIFSALANTTYVQLLYDVMNNPLVIGLTVINANTQNQVQQPLSLTTQNARGMVNTVPFVSPLDPYQQINTALALKKIYKCDGFTSITISLLLHTEVMLFWLYPSNIATLGNTLANENITENFNKPDVIRETKVQVNVPALGY